VTHAASADFAEMTHCAIATGKRVRWAIAALLGDFRE
jgi:hypothetical protein